MRINKYLALRGDSTRRGADILVEDQKVTINGRLAKLGDKVNEGDKVIVKDVGKKEYFYYAYYKPRGMITHSPQNGEESIEEAIREKLPDGLFPVGRLDMDSHGLIILTSDGRITEKLLSPERYHEKEYIVTIDKPVTSSFLKNMERGVDIEGYTTKPAKARETGLCKIDIVLTEGKKHQLRRMCASLGFTIKDIKRIRIMNIKLNSLNPRSFRQIKGKELAEFLGLLH